MNTGVQKSGATPEGAWTTTTPAGAPRAGQKKDIARIMAAHGIPVRRDARARIGADAAGLQGEGRRAPPRCEGFRFLHVLGGCPPGWRYPTAQSTEVARLAVESRYFPLFECDDGEWRITFQPKHAGAGRASSSRRRDASATSPPDEIDAIQAHVDERWDLLAGLASVEAQPAAIVPTPVTLFVTAPGCRCRRSRRCPAAWRARRRWHWTTIRRDRSRTACTSRAASCPS